MTTGGGVSAQGNDARVVSANAALTSRPRTPAAMSLEHHGESKVTALCAEVTPGANALEPAVAMRQGGVERRCLRCGRAVVAVVEQPRLEQCDRHTRILLADPFDQVEFPLQPQRQRLLQLSAQHGQPSGARLADDALQRR